MMLHEGGREFKMDWNRRAVRGLRLGRSVLSASALVLSLMVSVVAPGLGQVSKAAAMSQETPLKFDIQAQPLASALDRYGDATGREVFYDAALAEGRRSGGVKGSFTPAAAMQMLLKGTGLSARFMADDSFVLLPNPSPNHQPVVRTAPPAVHQRYYARIQQKLRDAFCRRGDAQPGRYRVVAVFWIDPSGDVQRVQRLGSAGTIDVDRRIDETLHSVTLDEPPPAAFMQPVLMMIVPQAPGVTMGCESGSADLRPVRAEQP
jgi:hypothetical protein